MKESVVTISREDLNNFERQYKESTGSFIIYDEFSRRKLSTPEPDFYKYIEGQDMEPYKTFVGPFDTAKLYLLCEMIR